MIRGLFLIVALLGIYLQLSAQNYNSIIIGDTSYYIHNRIPMFTDEYVEAAIHIDSISPVSGGSALFNYVRFDFPQSGSCAVQSRSSWLGTSITSLTNGWDIFTNEDGDSVYVNCLAGVGNSWELYRYPNNNYIEATVIAINTLNIVGVSDDVKIIELQTKNASGTSIAGLFNSKQLLLSQNHGFIRAYNFRTFPMDTSSYQITGWQSNNTGSQNLLAFEIFDFDIGDEFHYHSYWSASAPYHDEDYLSYVVLNKSISGNGDTLTYTMDRNLFHENGNFSTITTYFYQDTIDVVHILSQQQHLNALPEEFITTSNTWWPVPLYGFSIPVVDTSYFSRSKKFGEDFYEYDGFNNCYTWPIGSGIFPTRIFARGLGEIYETDPTYSFGRFDSLVYYKKGTEEWGNRLNWSQILGVSEIAERFTINLFPNPSNGLFKITCEKNFGDNLILEITNPVGQKISEQLLPSGTNEFEADCNYLRSGIYLYTISKNNQPVVRGKLVITKD